MTRFVIYGAGAIGGGIGGRLAIAGADVTLITRGAHLDAIRADGLRLRSAEGTDRVEVSAVGRAADAGIGAGDVVILTTKSQDTPVALADLTAHASRDAAVVCAQNGVDNERQALRCFASVYGLSVMMPATRLEPGQVDLDASPVFGILDLGRYPQGTDETAEEVAKALGEAGFASVADPAIMRRKYRKLLRNLGNVIDAAIGLDSAEARQLQRRAVAEAEAILDAAGVEVGSVEDDERRRQAFRYAPIPGVGRRGSSSWQSVALGRRSLEVDYLNGEIVLMARAMGLTAPVNEALVRLGDELLRRGGPPRSLSVADVEQ